MIRKSKNLKMDMDSEIRKLLKKYRSSQIDEIVLATCPFYESETGELTSAYRFIHDFVTSRVLERLQLKLSEVAVTSEFPLEFGRVDGAVSRISLTNGGNPILFIEIKTGAIKLVQPAIYTYFEGVKTLVAELKTGEVLTIDVETARRLLKEVIRYINDREKLRELGKRIPGRECVYCSSDCEFRLERRRKTNPVKSLPRILNNIEVVVEKILAEIAREVEGRKIEAYE